MDGTARTGRDEELLLVIAAEFPRLRVEYAHGGYIAIPAGAELTAAVTLGRLLEKLRAGRDGGSVG